MTFPLWLVIAFSFNLAVTVFALSKGGTPERLVASFIFIASQVNYLIPDRRWIDVQFAMMWLDVFAFLFLVGVALIADRWWPLWTAGLQGLSVAIHFAFWAQHKVISLAYMTALNIIGYGVILTVAIGTLSYVRRQKPQRQLQ